MLELRGKSSATRADVRRSAQAKIADIESKVRDLQRMREALAKLTKTCHGDRCASGFPILTALKGAADDLPGPVKKSRSKR